MGPGNDEVWVPVRGRVRRSALLQRLDQYLGAGIRFDPTKQLALQPIWKMLEGDGLIPAWRARPLCLSCGLPGETAFAYGGEKGVLCLPDARRFYPNRHLPSPRILEWVIGIAPRMRAARGRPKGSTDISVEELERKLTDVFRTHGRRATLALAAAEVNVPTRTIQQRLRDERGTTFSALRERITARRRPEAPSP